MRTALAELGLIAAVGCASIPSADVVMAPDGRRAWHIDCGRSRVECFDLAEETCPAGYRVLDSAGQYGTVGFAANNVAMIAPAYRGSMLIRCKKLPVPSE